MESNHERENRPLAIFPWADTTKKGPLSFHSLFNVKLKDSAVFKKTKIPAAQKATLISSFKFFNKEFPFYIPLEHHRMDVTALLQRFGPKDCWKAAALFLTSCKLNGAHEWEFDTQVNSIDGEDTCKPTLSKDLLTSPEIFPDGIPQQRENAFEYIFEHWILMQLPFEPVIFHQWLIAVFFEALSFEMEMSEFYSFPFPTSCLPAVNKLDLALKRLNCNIGLGFDWLQSYLDTDQEAIEANSILFPDILNETLTILEFWFTSGASVIRALKKRCWSDPSSNPNEALVVIKKAKHPLHERNFIYNLKWWTDVNAAGVRMIFGPSEFNWMRPEKKDKRKCRLNLNRQRKADGVRKCTTFRFSFDALFSAFKKRCKPSFSTVTGISRNKRKCSLKCISTLLKIFFNRPIRVNKMISTYLRSDAKLASHIRRLKNNLNQMSLLKIQPKELGILGSILHMKSRVDLVDSVTALAKYLCTVLEISPAAVYNMRPELATDMELLIITDSFLRKKWKKEEFNLGRIISRKAKEIERQRLYKPAMETVGALRREQLRRLELRVKKLVANTIKIRYDLFLVRGNVSNTEKQMNIRDWQTGQYLLPCFLASFADYSMQLASNSEVYRSYLNVVTDLMSKCEAQGFSQSLWRITRKSIESCLGLYLATANFRGKHFIREHIQGSITGLHLSVVGRPYFEVNPVEHFLEDVLDRRAESCEHWTWLIWDFFQRIILVTRLKAERTMTSEFDKERGIVWLIRTLQDHKDEDCVPDQTEIDVLWVTIKYCLEDSSVNPYGTFPDMQELEEKIRSDACFLDEKRVLQLALFFAMQYPRLHLRLFSRIKNTPEPNKALALEILLHSYLTDQWALRKFVFDFLKNSEIPTREFALKMQSCYEIPLDHITKLSRKKKKPLNIWYFPVKHCRYCGSLEAKKKFILCPLCVESDAFPDRSYFCGPYCFKTGMAVYHYKEHQDYGAFKNFIGRF